MALLSIALLLVVASVMLSTVADAEGEGEVFVSGSGGELDPPCFIRPGRSQTLKFVCYHNMSGPDTLLVVANLSQGEWTVDVDRTSFADLGPLERRYFNVTMTAPHDVPEGQVCDLEVTVVSLSTNRSDRCGWVCFAYWRIDLRMTVNDSEPLNFLQEEDLTRTWTLEVENVGDVGLDLVITSQTTRDYELAEDGVTIVLEPSSVLLRPGESANATLRISVVDGPPVSAGVVYLTTMEALNGTKKQLLDRVEIHWAVPLRFEVDVDPQTGRFPAHPLHESEVYINFSQVTNDIINENVWVVTATTSLDDWSVKLYNARRSLTGNKSAVVCLAVMPPPDAPPGTTQVVSLAFDCERWPYGTVAATYEFVVQEYRCLALVVDPPSIWAGPGDRFTMNATVLNHGNVEQLYNLDISVPDYLANNLTITALSGPLGDRLEPRSYYEVEITFQLTESAQAGDHQMTFNCTGTDVFVPPINITLDIERVMAFDGVFSTQSPVLINPNLDPPSVEYRVRNKGNVPVFVTLDTTVRPPGSGLVVDMEGAHPVERQLLLASHVLVVGLRLDPSGIDGAFTNVRNGSVTIACFHLNGTVLTLGTIDWRLVGPDLTVTDVVLREEEVQGRYRAAIVMVKNVGSGASLEAWVSLVGSRAREGDVKVTVPSLAPGDSIAVTLLFEPRQGRHTYWVIVDPDQALVEDGTAVNRHEFELVVDAPREQDELDLMVIMVVVALMTAFLVSALYLSRSRTGRDRGRGGASEEDQWEPMD